MNLGDENEVSKLPTTHQAEKNEDKKKKKNLALLAEISAL